MPYIGQSLTEGTRREYTYVATASQTTFNAIYTVGAVDVYQNGVLLAPSDYTATTGTTVVFNTGAALNDEITIHCHNTFSVADTVSASQGGAFSAAVTVAGNVTATKFLTTANKIETSIFRVNAQSLTADTTIDADENASAAGPLTIASGVTLTITSGGSVSIV